MVIVLEQQQQQRQQQRQRRQQRPEYYASPTRDMTKMNIHTITDLKTPPPSRRSSYEWETESRRSSLHDLLPHTPPQSTSGSPHVKSEFSLPKAQISEHFPVRLHYPNTPITSPIRLPSLEEFDQGVEALARSYSPPPSWTAPSQSTATLPSISQAVYDQKPLPTLLQHHHHHHQNHHHAYSRQQQQQQQQQQHPLAGSPQNHHGYHSGYSPMGDGYPSPPPDLENRHCNKKYTTEEGDFIIYAWHDKKQKWQSIQKDFARLFGTTPERTIQGLQAWYYRMNQRIPVWDRDGHLIFDDEDDIEPRYISIKCRERDAVHKSEPLGLAQRYPERAIHYHWVDPEIKRQSRDWAAKRTQQYQDRKERRKRKEQRRSRL